jgi:acyl dehydratase
MDAWKEQGMNDGAVAIYDVRAFNTAAASENKMHDDATARRFGFRGGLVPGVEVYAYMTHAPVARFGSTWLERGGMECRLVKPVYDGSLAKVIAEPDGDDLIIRVESDGDICATGRSWLSESTPTSPTDALPSSAPPRQRPPASVLSLAPGTALGIAPLRVDEEGLASYLADVGETHSIYAREGLVHPGQILRLANAALAQNVVLGPWIHVGSLVENFAPARLGDELTLRARISSNSEKKGHGFVELDALVVANGAVPVARIHHTAIWRPRQIEGA